SSVDHGGNPLGSAVVFPLLADGSAETSSTYRLVAGSANLVGAASVKAAQSGADPSAVDRTSTATPTLEGLSTYTYTSKISGSSAGSPGSFFVDSNLGYSQGAAPSMIGTPYSLTDWISLLSNPSSGLTGMSDTGVAVFYLASGIQGVDHALVI